jgi:hypothetical protein
MCWPRERVELVQDQGRYAVVQHGIAGAVFRYVEGVTLEEAREEVATKAARPARRSATTRSKSRGAGG